MKSVSLLFIVGVALNSTACGDAKQASAAAPLAASSDCQALRDDFRSQLWEPVLSQKCIGCHKEGGYADARHARFILQDDSSHAGIANNLEAVRKESAYADGDLPLLLRKPTGGAGHGGKVVIAADSKSYAAIKAFIERSDLAACASD